LSLRLKQESWMRHALAEAQRAGELGEVPVGAVVVMDDEIVGRGCNQPISSVDPTAHAEIVALRDAAKAVGNYRLPGSSLYVTLEPCTMCAGALVHARIGCVVFGAAEPRSGALISTARVLDNAALNHRVDVVQGVLVEQCAQLLQRFFADRR
jgi:tRNA(adenine34) deaminase